MNAARVAIANTPGAEEVLRQNWMKVARFSASFGITEIQFRNGVSGRPPRDVRGVRTLELPWSGSEGETEGPKSQE